MRSLVLALAAASMVGGVAFHATLAPSSQSSTVADEATTVSKVDRVAVVEPEPPQEAVPAAVLVAQASQTDFLRPSFEASRTASMAPSTQASPTDFYEVAEEASEDRTALEISSGPPGLM